MALREVRHLGGPVVHLGVDVDGVVRAPGRVEVMIPDPLEVRGLGAGTRRRNQEIAPVLEQQGDEGGIRSRSEAPNALVGRLLEHGLSAASFPASVCRDREAML